MGAMHAYTSLKLWVRRHFSEDSELIDYSLNQSSNRKCISISYRLPLASAFPSFTVQDDFCVHNVNTSDPTSSTSAVLPGPSHVRVSCVLTVTLA